MNCTVAYWVCPLCRRTLPCDDGDGKAFKRGDTHICEHCHCLKRCGPMLPRAREYTRNDVPRARHKRPLIYLPALELVPELVKPEEASGKLFMLDYTFGEGEDK